MTRVASRIISVGGGKGGVGKSVVATNLAVAFANSGREVALVDADLGAANLHTLLGVTKPGPTVQSFLDHDIESLEQARVPTGVKRLTLVRGANAVFGAANPVYASKQRLLRHVESLEADLIIVDVGAGMGFNQLDLFDVADTKLVVLTPQLTSVENAYGFVKAAVFRALGPVLKAHGFERLLADDGAETARLAKLLEDAVACSPKLGAEVMELLRTFNVKLVGNLLSDPREARVFPAVANMMRDFLSLTAPVLTSIRATHAVHESVNRRFPVLLLDRRDEASLAFARMAELLLDEPAVRRAA